MSEWLRQTLESSELGLLLLFVSLLAGLITSAGAVCNYPVLGAMAGYAASREKRDRAVSVLVCLGFFAAVGGSLAVAGAVAGSMQGLGQYGKIVAGFMTIIFGMIALNLVPFKFPKISIAYNKQRVGVFGGFVFGLTMGLVSSGCTFSCCAPLLWLALGAASVKGNTVFGSLIMIMFAIGFSVPMIVIMFGIGLGKMSNIGSKLAGKIRFVGGVLLIGMGFWLLTG